MRTAVLGAGSWGTTFAKVVGDAGHPVTVLARRDEVAQLRGVALPDRFAADLAAWDETPPRTAHGAAHDTGEDAAHDARQDEETR